MECTGHMEFITRNLHSISRNLLTKLGTIVRKNIGGNLVCHNSIKEDDGRSLWGSGFQWLHSSGQPRILIKKQVLNSFPVLFFDNRSNISKQIKFNCGLTRTGIRWLFCCKNSFWYSHRSQRVLYRRLSINAASTARVSVCPACDAPQGFQRALRNERGKRGVNNVDFTPRLVLHHGFGWFKVRSHWVHRI